MSRKEKRLNEKPWITRGILTSIKTKNRLFIKYYKSNSSDSSKKTTIQKIFKQINSHKKHSQTQLLQKFNKEKMKGILLKLGPFLKTLLVLKILQIKPNYLLQ